jgi:hypothetical protein
MWDPLDLPSHLLHQPGGEIEYETRRNARGQIWRFKPHLFQSQTKKQGIWAEAKGFLVRLQRICVSISNGTETLIVLSLLIVLTIFLSLKLSTNCEVMLLCLRIVTSYKWSRERLDFLLE